MPRMRCTVLIASCFACHAHGGYISPKKSTTRSPAFTPVSLIGWHTTPKPLRCAANISGVSRALAARLHSALATAVSYGVRRRSEVSARSSAASAMF